MEVFRNIQFGVDIATSLTIIGALLSWLLNQRKVRKDEALRREQERQRGINDAARAVVAQSINSVISNLAGSFNQIVTDGTYIENRIDRAYAVGGRDALIRYLDSGLISLDDIQERLVTFRERISNFYESAASSRYLLIPSLYSLPEGGDAIQSLKRDFQDIMAAHNRIAGGYVALLSELRPLAIQVLELKKNGGNPEENGAAFYEQNESAVDSIVFDEDYFAFIETCVPSGREEDFRRLIESGVTRFSELDDSTKALVGSVLSNFIGTLLKSPNQLIATVLLLVSKELQLTRCECKEALVNLAAISARVHSKENTLPIAELAQELRSDKYFNVGSEIR